MPDIQLPVEYRSTRQTSNILAIIALIIVLPTAVLEVLPFLIPGLLYPFGFDGTPVPPVLVPLPVPFPDWFAWYLQLTPMLSFIIFIIAVALEAGIFRPLRKLYTAHMPYGMPHTWQENKIVFKLGLPLALKQCLAVLTLFSCLAFQQMSWAANVLSFWYSPTYLRSVAMISATEGWAVGFSGADAVNKSGVIWHYSNGNWSRYPLTLTRERLYAITALPDGEAWAVGSGRTLLHEVGGTWSVDSQWPFSQSFIASSDELYAIAMRSPDEGWAVGGERGIGRYNDISLRQAPSLTQTTSLASLVTQTFQPTHSSTRTTHTAFSFRCFIMHYLHGHWSPLDCPVDYEGALQAISITPDGDVWVGGADGLILHEHNGTWAPTQSPLYKQDAITGLSMVSATEGWATGYEGEMLHYHNGTWSESPRLAQRLYGLTMISPTEG